ncbi:alpha/beta hydrolase [Xanthomonas arboricola]|uniref:alpha/beta hydrolase n=1 Tax=Xanthomonas arboricola TaxID=56448 RepID=UPI001431454E|nr:alpha/beta hydrolase [Xanthomonas arboricola]NJB92999.1 acetyl esterase/lipase [Xanthomonas arboricola]
MAEHGKPNPIIDTLSNVIGAIRADDDMHDLAQAHDALEPKAIEKLTPAEARQQPTIADAVKKLLHDQGKSADPEALVPGVKRTSHTLETPAGNLPAFVYTPQGGTALPVIVYFHGGGWVIANAEVYDGGARGLAKEAGAIVVSVDYRQAPEHKFPAAWDDALAAYEWVLANAASIGGNPQRVALAGESAGGNLAIATAVAARDKGLPAPTHILAVYPVGQTGSLHTESYIENAIAKPLNKAMIEWFVGHLIRSDADKSDTRLDLVNANLRGLAPVTIINATIDPLRSDGAKLEDALKDAHVPVEREVYTGVTHEFFGCAAVVAKAKAAQEYAGKRLRESFR